jgi:sugar phosphate isomerase/epimerase
MESFYMHHSDTQYGVACSDRVALFKRAQQLGFDGIEFGLNQDCAQDPLWTGKGNLRQAMVAASLETGVEARSLCLHLFNYEEYSPASLNPAHRAMGRRIVMGAMEACSEIGASVILVPFFGTGSLRTPDQTEHLISEMRGIADTAESLGIFLALETALAAPSVLEILERIGSTAVGVYFDVANTAGLDHDVVQEIRELGSRIVQVHIKEHPRTPLLGSGEIDFPLVAQALHQIDYDDYLVVEQPTSEDSVTRANLSYLRQVMQGQR